MFKKGVKVVYRNAAKRVCVGTIDRTSSTSGKKLFRVDNQWFPQEALTLFRPKSR